MIKTRFTLGAAPLFCVWLTGTALADDAAEKYVDDALPLTYHTCQSVVDEAAGDDSYIDNVVRALVGLSLYNREIDVSVIAKTEDEKAALHDRFVDALKYGCQADTNALLAGIVDSAVVHALK